MKQIDELDEQKCTQKIGILPGPTKKWRIKRIDELDEFYFTCKMHYVRKLLWTFMHITC